MPKPLKLDISLRNFPEKDLNCTVFDLHEKVPVYDKTGLCNVSISLGESGSDYLLVIR